MDLTEIVDAHTAYKENLHQILDMVKDESDHRLVSLTSFSGRYSNPVEFDFYPTRLNLLGILEKWDKIYQDKNDLKLFHS